MCRGKCVDEVWTRFRRSGSELRDADGQPGSTRSGDQARLTVSDFFASVGIQDLPPSMPLDQVCFYDI